MTMVGTTIGQGPACATPLTVTDDVVTPLMVCELQMVVTPLTVETITDPEFDDELDEPDDELEMEI